jgi:ribonucleoside-diphosphate reductase alpha chain
MEVGAWVYKHIDEMSGVSFLPYSEHTYQQAPYQEISEDEYNVLVLNTPKAIDWNWLKLYETEDLTTGSQEYACVAGYCEITDIK